MTVSARLEETSSLPPPAPGQGKEGEDGRQGGHQDESQASPFRGHDSLVKVIVIVSSFVAKSTGRMTFETTMPMRSRRPSRDGRLKAVSVRKRAPKAPTVVRGRRGV